MRRQANTETAKLKSKVQALVRAICLKRDGECVLKGYRFPCHEVLQAHHLVSRGKNIGYADTRLIVLICKGHHTAITYAEGAAKREYDAKLREVIGPQRTILLDRAEKDQKSHPMSAADWAKEVMALQYQLDHLS